MAKIFQESHLFSVYFAPRGKMRMINLGMILSQKHLSATDRLIGVIGDPGCGKSILVKGMFPGLELTNDDDGVNIRPLPLLRAGEKSFTTSHTFHMDVRFEMAFTSLGELAQAVRAAVDAGKRVIVEHFDLLYPVLGINAELLIGVGEEVIITRPTIFGPEPKEIYDIVSKSNRYRKMAHTAENLTERILAQQGDYPYHHGDVRHGFVLEFDEKPDVELPWLEQQVKDCIARDFPVSYCDEEHVYLGEEKHPCTGPRLHVRSTGEIENFSLLKDYLYDPMSRKYLLVGLVGSDEGRNLCDLNRLTL